MIYKEEQMNGSSDGGVDDELVNFVQFPNANVNVRIINLDAHQYKLSRILAMLKSYDFLDSAICRLPAVNGNAIPEEEKHSLVTLRALCEIKSKIRYSHAGMPSWGAVGCTLSHKLIWEECAKENSDYPYLVLEDDAYFLKNRNKWSESFNGCVSSANKHWDICMLGPMFGTECDEIDPYTSILTNPYPFGKEFIGTHAYLITANGAKLLLKYVLPIGDQTDFFIQSIGSFYGLRIAKSTYSLAIQLNTKSSVQVRNTLRCEKSIQFYIQNVAAFLILFLVLLLWLRRQYRRN